MEVTLFTNTDILRVFLKHIILYKMGQSICDSNIELPNLTDDLNITDPLLLEQI
jgi:hypothetical protein